MRRKQILAGALWLAALLLLAGSWLWSGNKLLVICGIGLFLLPFLSAAILFLCRKHLHLSIEVDPVTPKNTAVQVTVRFTNSGKFPFGRAWCRLLVENGLTGERTQAELSAEVPAKGSSCTGFLLQSSRCGDLSIRPEKLFLLDVLGFLSIPAGKGKKSKTVILPDTFAPDLVLSIPAISPDDSDTWAPDRIGTDLSETYQLREYIPGDELKRVHWKLSDKLDRLVVRDPSFPQRRSMLVFWDKSAGSMNPEIADTMAEVVSSVCQSLSDAGMAYTLAWNDRDQCITEEIENTDALLRLIPRMISGRGGLQSGAALWLQHIGETGFGRILYLSTALPDEARLLAGNSLTTWFICSDTVPESDQTVLTFTPQDYLQTLQHLELT